MSEVEAFLRLKRIAQTSISMTADLLVDLCILNMDLKDPDLQEIITKYSQKYEAIKT